VRSAALSHSHWITEASTFSTSRPEAVEVLDAVKRVPLGEATLEEVAEVAHRPGEAVELRHEEPVGGALVEEGEGAVESGRSRLHALAPSSRTTVTISSSWSSA
jgi:hypothetical protein